MNSVATVLLLLLFWSPTPVMGAHLATCLTNPSSVTTTMTSAEAIRMELLRGYWQGPGLSTMQQRLVFQADGQLAWLTIASDKSTATLYTWSVVSNTQGSWLQLQAPGEHHLLLQIIPTCEGMTLRNPNTNELLVLSLTQPLTNQAAIVESRLLGEWEASLPAAKLKESANWYGSGVDHGRLQYIFYRNGLFEKILSIPGQEIQVREQGTWHLTIDGEHLLLEENGLMQCLRIKYIQVDELVLAQAMDFPSMGLSLPASDVYFNKF